MCDGFFDDSTTGEISMFLHNSASPGMLWDWPYGPGVLREGQDVFAVYKTGWSLQDLGAECDWILWQFDTKEYRVLGPSAPRRMAETVVTNAAGEVVDRVNGGWICRMTVIRRGSAYSIENGYEE